MVHDTMWRKFLDALPHGQSLTEDDWRRRHRIMLWVLGLHVPALGIFGLALGYDPRTLVLVLITPVVAGGVGHLLTRHRRTAAITVTFGLVYCSAALVGLSHGSIEAHFHFFVIIGFIALYQDWAPFLFNIIFTVLSHGIGSTFKQGLFFNHAAGQANPWLWSLIHGIAVLFTCVGMVLFWRVTEDSQWDKDVLTKRLAETEINRRRFTSDLLTNLARRNQSLLHRQLDIINQLEESEEDPDALAELFALDHIATRVRRNAENLLVLSGEQPPRTWSEPVALRDVLRAAIAETENLERVVFVVDEQSAVVGHTVTDLTHLLAELTENAVRFSPPDTTVTIRSRPDRARPGGRLITIEDWGLGMPTEQIEEANALLGTPLDIDLSISQRLGFHVVARLAARHGVKVSLSVTPGSGTTALIMLPPSLFASQLPSTVPANEDAGRRHVDERPKASSRIVPLDHVPAWSPPYPPDRSEWSGWWDPAVASTMPAFDPTPAKVNGSALAVGTPTYHTATRSPHTQTSHTDTPPTKAPPAGTPTNDVEPIRPRPRPSPSPSPSAQPAVIEGGPVPAQRPTASPKAGGLSRRVPQSHLSAQLRTPEPESAANGSGAERTTAETAAALSRYQASRASAQAAAEKGNRT
jgi:signal transduction histidine kinase